MVYTYDGLSDEKEGGTTAQTSKYTIVSLLSDHPDSPVWLAEHRGLHVKRILKGIRKDSPNYKLLLNEAHLLKNLKHPSIPEIFDLEEDDEYTYIIEQYIEGDSLGSLCSKRLLSEKEIFHFIIQLCNIISYLHSLSEAVLYLDIKPENIIISEDKCYLIDFGSAHLQNDAAGSFFGTRSYASPEQKNGDRLSKRSDIYSIGRLLEFMVDHCNISQKNEKALRRLASRCSEKKIWNRIGSAKSIIAHINSILGSQDRFSDKPVKIAFAGASHNTGTTYLALLFSIYLNNIGKKCLYAEANDSEAWYSISSDCKQSQALAGLEKLSRKTYENGRYDPSCIIADYGCLYNGMPKDFYDHDLVCITAGNKVWETEEIFRARALSQKCIRTIFLINLTDRLHDKTAEAVKNAECIAIPYIPGFDNVLNDEEVKAVFHELAVMTGIVLPQA